VIEYQHQLAAGIRRSPEFARKLLATCGVAVGVKCGHGCLYCSTPAVYRCNAGFRAVGRSPFDPGYCIVDPDTAARVRRDIGMVRPQDVVMLSHTSDAWSPEAQRYGIGPECLRILLEEGKGVVRILTKNAAVEDSLPIMARHRDRVRLGLTVTAPAGRQEVVGVLEPFASTIAERLRVLEAAHRLGISTYGMMCPCLPGIADDQEALREMFESVIACGAEETWVEPVNARGNGLRLCEQALSAASLSSEARAVNQIRTRANWSEYAARLARTAQTVAKGFGVLDRLHILLYAKTLDKRAVLALKDDERGIVWL
jgi:DNA repair photolyase